VCCSDGEVDGTGTSVEIEDVAYENIGEWVHRGRVVVREGMNDVDRPSMGVLEAGHRRVRVLAAPVESESGCIRSLLARPCPAVALRRPISEDLESVGCEPPIEQRVVRVVRVVAQADVARRVAAMGGRLPTRDHRLNPTFDEISELVALRKV
jgi:hypothetical protein